MNRKLFVNLAVNDLPRAVRFFTALGFRFDERFTDATATCMLVGEDAYFMLLTREKFSSFTKRAISDPRERTEGMYAITAKDRAEVDLLLKVALANGATPAMPPSDLGFMYGVSFYDPDGHHWEIFWMDEAAAQSELQQPPTGG